MLPKTYYFLAISWLRQPLLSVHLACLSTTIKINVSGVVNATLLTHGPPFWPPLLAPFRRHVITFFG